MHALVCVGTLVSRCVTCPSHIIKQRAVMAWQHVVTAQPWHRGHWQGDSWRTAIIEYWFEDHPFPQQAVSLGRPSKEIAPVETGCQQFCASVIYLSGNALSKTWEICSRPWAAQFSNSDQKTATCQGQSRVENDSEIDDESDEDDEADGVGDQTKKHRELNVYETVKQ